MAITLNVNGQARTVDVEPDTPLLWVLRDTLGLTGTKFGCGIAACGACTVHLDGRAVRTCTLPVSAAEGMPITTIEGLAGDGRLHAVQQAWIDHQVPQCGYCQSGMIMAVSALLAQRPDPSDEHIDAAVTNICRCGTFVRVRRAIHAAARAVPAGVAPSPRATPPATATPSRRAGLRPTATLSPMATLSPAARPLPTARPSPAGLPRTAR